MGNKSSLMLQSEEIAEIHQETGCKQIVILYIFIKNICDAFYSCVSEEKMWNL